MRALATAYSSLREIERDVYLGARRSGATPREAYRTASSTYRMIVRTL
jgi:hypothetical protein